MPGSSSAAFQVLPLSCFAGGGACARAAHHAMALRDSRRGPLSPERCLYRLSVRLGAAAPTLRASAAFCRGRALPPTIVATILATATSIPRGAPGALRATTPRVLIG